MVVDTLGFIVTPSGNISCYFEEGDGTCVVQVSAVCKGNASQVIQFHNGSVQIEGCKLGDWGDAGDVRTLQYGETIADAHFICDSQRTGLTCVSRDSGESVLMKRAGSRLL